MLPTPKRSILIIVLLFCLFVFSGCNTEEIKKQTLDKLESLDQKVEDKWGSSDNKGSATSSPEQKEENVQASDLTPEQKKKIDEWLEENNLNRYGDSREAIYPDGSPLYNEDTGQEMTRFEYILDRYPDILERINNDGQ